MTKRIYLSLILIVFCIQSFGQAPEKSPSLENFPECDKQVKELAEKLWFTESENSLSIKKYGDGYSILKASLSYDVTTGGS